MLYKAYELQCAMMTGASVWASVTSELLANPMSPFGAFGLGSVMSSALDVFAHAAAPRGKPAFDIESVTVDGETHPVTEAMLLQPSDLSSIAPTGWQTTSTSGNTAGSGLHTPCQASRFADDRGLAAWVRTFSGPGGRTAVQSVEVSASPGATVATYRSTVNWYAGCTRARMHLVDSYRVAGLGDQAVALDLSAPGGDR